MTTFVSDKLAAVEPVPMERVTHYRTVWISDVHLGTRGSDARMLLDFLRCSEFEKLYIVGDFIDVWQLRRSRCWRQEHNDVVQKVLRRARKGVPIVYIPGNHDEFCCEFLGDYGNIRVVQNDVHVTADGRRLQIMHGHEFDAVTLNARWLAVLGDIGYTLLLKVNTPLNLLRRLLGKGHWSLSAYVKAKVKGAVNHISHFEKSVAHYARLHEVDGIVCGHIHSAAARAIEDVQYYNCGDWVESSTALVEHLDGSIEVVEWRKHPHCCSGSVAPLLETA